MTLLRGLLVTALWMATLCNPAHAGVGSCPGDCNDDGEITVDEIITGVSIALGTIELSTCSRFDRGGDRLVTVDEILQAIAAALGGCSEQTPGTTPLVTSTPTATTTPGPSSVAQRIAGTIDVSSRIFLAVPEVIGALLGRAIAAQSSRDGSTMATAQLQAANGREPRTLAPRGLIDIPFDCPAGGTGAVHCDQRLSGLPPLPVAEYTLDFEQCAVTIHDDRTVRIDGTVELEGNRGDICGQLSDDLDLDISSLIVESTGGAVSTITTLTDVHGEIELHGDDEECGASEIELRLSGNVKVDSSTDEATAIANVEATLDDTHFDIDVTTYGEGCVPVEYTLTVNGNATIISSGTNIAVSYEEFRLEAAPADASTLVVISGGLEADCFNGAAMLTTTTPLRFGLEESCASVGAIAVAAGASSGTIRYADGGVEIDADNDGDADNAFTSCHDVELFTCP